MDQILLNAAAFKQHLCNAVLVGRPNLYCPITNIKLEALLLKQPSKIDMAIYIPDLQKAVTGTHILYMFTVRNPIIRWVCYLFGHISIWDQVNTSVLKGEISLALACLKKKKKSILLSPYLNGRKVWESTFKGTILSQIFPNFSCFSIALS